MWYTICMNTTIRIPITKSLKKEAEKASRFYGFSSLVEALKALIEKLSKRELALSKKEDHIIHLSAKNEKRYAKMTEDFKKGKSIHYAESIDDFIEQLKSA